MQKHGNSFVPHCMLTSQPAISASYWYVFCSYMFAFCMFFTHFCSLFSSLLCSLLSQPSQPAIQPPPFSTQLHLPFLIPHSPFSLYRLLLLLAIFLTLQLHICKYVDSKNIIFLNQKRALALSMLWKIESALGWFGVLWEPKDSQRLLESSR